MPSHLREVGHEHSGTYGIRIALDERPLVEQFVEKLRQDLAPHFKDALGGQKQLELQTEKAEVAVQLASAKLADVHARRRGALHAGDAAALASITKEVAPAEEAAAEARGLLAAAREIDAVNAQKAESEQQERMQIAAQKFAAAVRAERAVVEEQLTNAIIAPLARWIAWRRVADRTAGPPTMMFAFVRDLLSKPGE